MSDDHPETIDETPGAADPRDPRRRWGLASLRTRVVVLAVLIVIVVGIWQWIHWAGRSSADASGDGMNDSGMVVGLTRFSQSDRLSAPGLSGRTLDGLQLDLADLRGHVVVLNAWGSWCGPCRGEAPDLAKAARTAFPWGARFVGIDTRDNDGAARAFIRAFKIRYPSIVDSDGSKLLPFAGLVPLSAVPSTIVIDAQGRIAATVVGPTTYATLVGLIRDELPHPAPRKQPRS